MITRIIPLRDMNQSVGYDPVICPFTPLCGRIRCLPWIHICSCMNHGLKDCTADLISSQDDISSLGENHPHHCRPKNLFKPPELFPADELRPGTPGPTTDRGCAIVSPTDRPDASLPDFLDGCRRTASI